MTDVHPYPKAAHRPAISSTGDAGLDAQIVEFVKYLSDVAEASGLRAHPDLVHDVLVEVAHAAALDARTFSDDVRVDERSNLKLTLRHMADLRALFKYMAQYNGQHVTIFGSARTAPGTPTYELIETTARALADEGYFVRNGGGPGAMAAATSGAGDRAVQVAIALPFEPRSADAGDESLVLDKFTIRKIGLMRDASALIAAPGGFGTLEELYEAITLMQTGKHPIMPVFLLEPEGLNLWDGFTAFNAALLEHGMVSAHDLELYRLVHTPEQVLEGIRGFYRAFHSYIRVDQRMNERTGMNESDVVMRLQEGVELTGSQLEELRGEFGDIITEGGIAARDLADKELREIERGLAEIPEVRVALPEYDRIYRYGDLARDEGTTAQSDRIAAAFSVPLERAESMHERGVLRHFSDLPRIGFRFNDRSYARLGQMVRRINAMARETPSRGAAADGPTATNDQPPLGGIGR